MMKIRNLILPILLCVPMLHSQDESEVVLQPPTDIEILLDLVKDSSTLRTKDDQKRLDDFLANKARQQKLLNDARWLLTKEKNMLSRLTLNGCQFEKKIIKNIYGEILPSETYLI